MIAPWWTSGNFDRTLCDIMVRRIGGIFLPNFRIWGGRVTGRYHDYFIETRGRVSEFEILGSGKFYERISDD